MASWRVLAPEEIAEVAGRLANLSWSWSAGDLDGVVAQLGWPLVSLGVAGAVVQNGLEPFNGFAEIGLANGAATEISVMITDGTSGESAEATAFRRDAFAAAVAAVSTISGNPAKRRPGPFPEVRWAVSDGVLRVSDDGIFVAIALLSTKYAEALDAERAEPFVDEDFAEEEW